MLNEQVCFVWNNGTRQEEFGSVTLLDIFCFLSFAANEHRQKFQCLFPEEGAG